MMHMNELIAEENRLTPNRLGALKRTCTGVTDGCQDAREVLYGSASAHPTHRV